MKRSATTEPASEQDPKQTAFHAIVHGAVQGVGFRYYTKTHAQRAGIAGWVRNREDGTVEVWAEGPKSSLKQLISTINRGPTNSHVAKVELTWKTLAGESRSFHIRY